MSVFRGEMAQPSDPQRLPAVVTIDEGSIRLETGRTELGEWNLHQVVLGERDDGVLLQVEGDELILFLEDRPRFLAETAPFRMLTERRRVARLMTAPKRERRPKAARKIAVKAAPPEPVQPTVPLERKPSVIAGGARRLVRLLQPYWPIWVGIVAFGLGVAFAPGLVTMVFLLAGVLVLAFGGLATSDTGLAVKIPSPFTPLRLIIVGGALATVGVLVDIVR